MGPGTHHEQMLTMFGVRLGKHGLRDREGTTRWTCLQVRRVVPLSPAAPSAVPLKLLRKVPYSTCWLRLRVMSRLRFGLAGPARQTSAFVRPCILQMLGVSPLQGQRSSWPSAPSIDNDHQGACCLRGGSHAEGQSRNNGCNTPNRIIYA